MGNSPAATLGLRAFRLGIFLLITTMLLGCGEPSNERRIERLEDDVDDLEERIEELEERVE